MENASKALVMAGGVLIAIMVIATLLYASNTFRILPEAEEQSTAVKQLQAFNKQYESYDRDALYGTDLVSVLNKAMDNNEKYGVKYGDDMYINIAFTINENIDGEESVYRIYSSGENAGKKINVSSKTLENILPKGTYYLANSAVTINNFLEKFYGTKIQSKIKKDNSGKYIEYTETIAGGSEFKAKVFKCTQVEYDDTGRIKYMEFKEQEVK